MNHTFKTPPDIQHYLGAPIFLTDYFVTLTGTEPLFRGIMIAVIDPFSSNVTIFPINLSSIGLPISWWQISTPRWACWDVNSLATDLQLLYDLPSVLISRSMISFETPSYSDSLRVHFCDFFKTLRVFSISNNLDLPERGKSLVFSSPVLKRWHHRCAKWSRTTPLLRKWCFSRYVDTEAPSSVFRKSFAYLYLSLTSKQYFFG